MQDFQAAQSVRARPQANALFSSPKRQELLIVLLLVAVTLFVYKPVKDFDFINYDDPFYVTNNLPVQGGFTWKNILWAFTSIEVGNWHPLTWISHMSDVWLFGLNPAGHHFMNLVWHSLNAVLLFLVLRRGTGSMWGSAFVAALFAVHPLNVQSVAWISERKNLLSTTFWLLAIYAYGWYVHQPNWKRYCSVVALFILGLMAKPMVITLPLVLLLLDYWPLSRMTKQQTNPVRTVFGPPALAHPNLQAQFRDHVSNFGWLVVEKLPLFVLTIVSSILTYKAQRFSEGSYLHSLFPLGFRVQNALVSYADYLFKTVWPTKLAVLYPLLPVPRVRVFLAGLTLVVATLTILRFRQKKYAVVGWLWYLGTLAPVIGLIQVGVQAKADRYAYLPLMGIFLAIVFAVIDVSKPRRAPTLALAPLAAIVLVMFAYDTRVQLRYWENSITLFSRALEVTPENNYNSNVNLATALSEAGRHSEALQYLYPVVKRFPYTASLHDDLGTVLRRQGKLQEAVWEYSFALRLPVDARFSAQVYSNLGLCLAQMGQHERAKASYSEAIRLNPFLYAAHANLGNLLYQEGRFEQAIDQLRQSLSILPTAHAYFLLGHALEEENKPEEALAAYRNGLSIAPRDPAIENRVESLVQKKEDKIGPLK